MAQVEIQARPHRFVSLLSREAADEPGLEPGMLAVAALEEQRSEKYRHALIAVVSIGVRAGQLGGTDASLSFHLVSNA